MDILSLWISPATIPTGARAVKAAGGIEMKTPAGNSTAGVFFHAKTSSFRFRLSYGNWLDSVIKILRVSLLLDLHLHNQRHDQHRYRGQHTHDEEIMVSQPF